MARVKFPCRIFITGTDTGIGKTIISAILMAGLSDCGYWKPVQSGLEEITDTEIIRRATGIDKTRFFPETYRLKAPLSPHASAALENVNIDLKKFQAPDIGTLKHLVVEGAGGIMVPLNKQYLMLDLMKKLGFPIILVAKSGLGTINHTLLSIEQLRRHNLDIFGVVLNGPANASNKDAIEHYGKVRVCAQVQPLAQINPQSLSKAFEVFA